MSHPTPRPGPVAEPTGQPAGEPVAAPAGHRPAHTGRRPGESGTRDCILAAARFEFAEGGYDGATIRGIAARAGVDPALVHHYFGAKEQLFERALELPISPATLLPGLLADDRERIGEHVVTGFLTVWEDPANRPIFMAMLRSIVSNEQAAELVRRLLVKEVFGPLAAALGVPDAELRATLAGSQFIGLALMRYVGRVEPLASADLDTVAAAVGPTIQRYLTGAIGR
jgi:AcrR family transcriptional regulator